MERSTNHPLENVISQLNKNGVDGMKTLKDIHVSLKLKRERRIDNLIVNTVYHKDVDNLLRQSGFDLIKESKNHENENSVYILNRNHPSSKTLHSHLDKLIRITQKYDRGLHMPLKIGVNVNSGDEEISFKKIVPMRDSMKDYEGAVPLGCGAFGCVVKFHNKVVKFQITTFNKYNTLSLPSIEKQEYVISYQLSKLKNDNPFIPEVYDMYMVQISNQEVLDNLKFIFTKNNKCEKIVKRLNEVSVEWNKYVTLVRTEEEKSKMKIEGALKTAVEKGYTTQEKVNEFYSTNFKNTFQMIDKAGDVIRYNLSRSSDDDYTGPKIESKVRREILDLANSISLPDGIEPISDSTIPVITVMELELANSGDLNDLLESLHSPLSKHILKSLLFQMIYCLYRIQKSYSITLCDIKAENVLLQKWDTTKEFYLDTGRFTIKAGDYQAVLADFGVAENSPRIKNWTNGTTAYICPAWLFYVKDKKSVSDLYRGPDSDIWSVGLMFWFMCAIHEPIPSDTDGNSNNNNNNNKHFMARSVMDVVWIEKDEQFHPLLKPLIDDIYRSFFGSDIITHEDIYDEEDEWTADGDEDIIISKQQFRKRQLENDILHNKKVIACAMCISVIMKSLGHPFIPPESAEIPWSITSDNEVKSTKNIEYGPLGLTFKRCENEICDAFDTIFGTRKIFMYLSERITKKIGHELYNTLKLMTGWLPSHRIIGSVLYDRGLFAKSLLNHILNE